MGYEWAKDLVHVPFGLVSLGDGKLSTRQGHVVLMEDILNQSVEKTRGIIESKNPNLENKEAVAEEVGIGAIIFDDLYNSRITITQCNFKGNNEKEFKYHHIGSRSALPEQLQDTLRKV